MQLTIYIPRKDESLLPDIKSEAERHEMGVGAYLVMLHKTIEINPQESKKKGGKS
ncbi:MAG: hypothetical protein V3U78_05405 [Thiotrichaceae bacterium]